MWALADTPPPLTSEQEQLLAVAKALSAQARGQLRLTFAGAVGLGLLFTTGYMIWRKR
jgi:hypothetical protein